MTSQQNPADLPILKFNSRNVNVAFLRYLLAKPTPTFAFNLLDYAKTPPTFDKELETDVKYFQATHLGPDGFFLEDDGIVGENTWWALLNPSGSSQRSFIDAKIPDRVYGTRLKILERAMKEYNYGVKEVPDNSNRGERIDLYTGGKAVPWCMKFVSYILRECEVRVPWDKYEGGTNSCYRKAVHAGIFSETSSVSYFPAPGDLFMIQYGDGKGHVGFVLRVNYDGDKLVSFNTIEGNAGNRVKIGLRFVNKEKNLVGFINVANDSLGMVRPEYELGVIDSKDRLDGRTR